jgi:hypothetical protein
MLATAGCGRAQEPAKAASMTATHSPPSRRCTPKPSVYFRRKPYGSSTSSQWTSTATGGFEERVIANGLKLPARTEVAERNGDGKLRTFGVEPDVCSEFPDPASRQGGPLKRVQASVLPEDKCIVPSPMAVR